MEPSCPYKDGEVVWVKWSNMWWPGEVYHKERVPEDMITALRKPVIAFVKFLQEDSFELVRSNNNISKYACEKKIEHIKKGIDKYRSNATMMENFSASITKAEQLTAGNVNIIKSLETPTKTKPSLNVNNSTPLSDLGRKSISSSITSPLSTTPTSKKAIAPSGSSSYNTSVKVQNTSNTEQNRSNDKRFTCTMCPFSTDRMNLLMMHIKGHSLEIQSRVNSSSSEIRRPMIPKTARKHEVDDGIAEDVRKIKESIKEQEKASTPTTTSNTARKPRASATTKVDKVTPAKTIVKSRTSKRSLKAAKEMSPEMPQQELDEDKPKTNEELKNKLLADWLDEEDIHDEEKDDPSKSPKDDEKPTPPPSSVPIRNIPKKQRVSELYIQPSESPQQALTNEINEKTTSNETNRKSHGNQKVGGRRKQQNITVDDDKLLMATANLLNETEVPKSVAKSATEDDVAQQNAQSPSTTFHKSNDIDKRNLPPKERNKRIFRARNKSSEIQSTPSLEETQTATSEVIKVVTVNKNDRQEMMLPHKKKQSSRLPISPSSTAAETVTNEEISKNQSNADQQSSRNKKKRKSSSDLMEIVEETQEVKKDIESPLRETSVNQNRGQKRHLSNDNDTQHHQQQQSDAKRFHKSHDALEPRTITCDASEAICITSKGTLTVARRDSLKTTQANSVVVTSQVIFSEPIITPIPTPSSSSTSINTPTSITTTTSSSVKSSPVVTLPQQTLKNALKIPKENLEDMKKQGLLTIENNRTKLTPKGLQIFKEYQREEKIEKVVTTTSSSSTSSLNTLGTSSSTLSIVSSTESASECEEKKIDDVNEEKEKEKDEEKSHENNNKIDEKEHVEDVEMKVIDEKEKISDKDEEEIIQKTAVTVEVEEKSDENQNNTEPIINDSLEEKSIDGEIIEEKKEEEKIEKEEPLKSPTINEKVDDDESTKENSDEQQHQIEKPKENGSSKEDDLEASNDDANTSSGGLIALQAETFGGPPNCFYLCRQIEDRYEPVDNQILVLNAQNALVPYEGEVLSEVAIPSGIEHPSVAENLAAYSQLSPNSNIIINTPNGQKVELNYFAIVALQDSADENGIASVELGGEQIELNINGILEAIAAQQEADSTELLPAIIDGTENAVAANSALILTESSDLAVDINHSATQVSETLSKPIMSTTVAPEIAPVCPVKSTIAEKNLNIDDSLASIGVTPQTTRANVPKSLELPITVTNPTIAETVNHRKLAAATALSPGEVVAENLLLQATDNGSGE